MAGAPRLPEPRGHLSGLAAAEIQFANALLAQVAEQEAQVLLREEEHKPVPNFRLRR